MSISKYNRTSFSHQLRRGCTIGALLVLGTTLPAYGDRPDVEIRILFSWSDLVPDFLLHMFDGTDSEPSSDLQSVTTRSETDTEIEAEPPDPFVAPEPAKTGKGVPEK